LLYKKNMYYSIYERRFTELDYSCASILDPMSNIKMALNETN